MTLAQQLGLPAYATKQQILAAAAAILGVSPTCNAQELKQAYRRAAFEAHPDRNNGDASKWQSVGAAYKALQSQDEVVQGAPPLSAEALERLVGPLADGLIGLGEEKFMSWLSKKGVAGKAKEGLATTYKALGDQVTESVLGFIKRR
jgi:hypothetical protein